MKVSVIGLGKAGLPLSAVIADSGIDVVGVDISNERVDEINKGINPIPEEPELGDILKKYGGNRLKATTDYSSLKECTSHIVIVPLFIDENKKPDFSIIKNAFEKLAGNIKDNDLVVLETTVPPGTTEGLIKGILDRSGKRYYLAYSPERIMTGYSVSRYKEFSKVVGGVDKESGKRAYGLYSRFCKKAELVSNARTAELIKVCEGTYRDVNIALANELFKVCEKEKVDYHELQKHAKHEFCNLLSPGNVGGHCIPVYPWFLINKFDVPLVKNARLLNDSMIEYYAGKLAVKKGKIAVVGLTYRDNVKETAYSRAFPLIKLLEKRGYEVYANDPMFSKEEIKKFGLKFTDELEKMDGIILMNKCMEYKERLAKLKDKVVEVWGNETQRV